MAKDKEEKRKPKGGGGPPPEREDVLAIWHALGMSRTGEPLDPDWLRFMAFALPQARRSHAQLFQDLWVIWETGHLEGGCFVEFGACDGVFLSNSLLLERAFAWRGVVAEPNPVYHEALAANRHCVVDTRCVWSRSGATAKFRAVKEPEYSAMADVDPDDHHERAGRRDRFELVEVETVSLVDLLVEAKLPKRIDYLSLDTEGSEYEILETFDFDAFDVRLITVEHNYTKRRGDIEALLVRKGFRRRFPGMTRWDDWYVSERLPTPEPAKRSGKRAKRA
ncbi:FkbM family methyltransferase [Sphingomonas sp. MMS24-J13]|uniref:FkbM family methyltransferase n=1 Tax=Sphingomonas sp. MMS24-J13 TaxID=3238686 RepID=UPI00384E7952